MCGTDSASYLEGIFMISCKFSVCTFRQLMAIKRCYHSDARKVCVGKWRGCMHVRNLFHSFFQCLYAFMTPTFRATTFFSAILPLCISSHFWSIINCGIHIFDSILADWFEFTVEFSFSRLLFHCFSPVVCFFFERGPAHSIAVIGAHNGYMRHKAIRNLKKRCEWHC